LKSRGNQEALINALCHRDYASPGGSITLTIYDDRLEIINTGLLPEGITLSELIELHTSHPRNPIITNVFYRRGLIEAMGMGIQQIMKVCADVKMKPPEFLEQAGTFIIRLWSRAYKPEVNYSDLSSRHKEILLLLKTETLSPGEILPQLTGEITDRTLRRDLQFLKERGYIDVKGSTWKAKWFTVE